MSNEIVKQDEKKPIRPGATPVGLAAKKKLAQQQLAQEKLETVGYAELPPNKMPDRIGIVFDDSGSMGGQSIVDAHDGVEKFLRSSKPQTTAVAVYPMNAKPLNLCTTLPVLAQLVRNIQATGGTPAVETLRTMLNTEDLTRAIMFSDGSFSMYSWNGIQNENDFWADSRQKLPASSTTLELCRIKKISVDTVFIGHNANCEAARNLKRIAEDTDGIFLHFVPGKASFAKAFKYLSSGLRLQLMDKSFKEKVENGEI